MNVLIYINKVGVTWDGTIIYEFIFGEEDTLDEVDGENWDTYPASGLPEPPIDWVTEIKILKTDLNLTVIQDSDTMSVWDAVDGVIALAWEETKDYEIYPDYRIAFKFGEPFSSVENKLFQKELGWQKEKIDIDEPKK